MAEERDFDKTYQKNTSRRRSSRRRRSQRRWRAFLLIYSVLFLALGAVGCYFLYQYADAYEQSRPELVMDKLMADTGEDQWFDYARSGGGGFRAAAGAEREGEAEGQQHGDELFHFVPSFL